MTTADLLSRLAPLRPDYATEAEEQAAERALLPPLERLLAGTGTTLAVLDDGPNPLFGALGAAGLEAPGLFVCLRCPAAAWPAVYALLAGAGVPVDDDVDEDDDGQVKTWLGDVRRECCPFGCGNRVYRDVERHAARCRLRPAQGSLGLEDGG